MRIAYICADSGVPVFGSKGASNHVRDFVRALTSLQHNVTLFAAKRGTPAREFCCPIEVVASAGPAGEVAPALRAEIASLARNTPLSDALRRAHSQGPFDLVYERYSLWSYAGLDFARGEGIPSVLEVNSPLRLEQKQYRELHLEPAAAAIELDLFRRATLIAAVSREVAGHVLRSGGRELPTIVVPNGVDLDLFAAFSEPADPPGPFTVGFVGSLKPWHGIETLFEAFGILARDGDPARLLVVGDGPLRRWMQRFAAERGFADSVELAGAIEKQYIPAALARMHVAVAPYPALEDFYFSPLKVFEYMAAGRAIVASAIGQVQEILRDGETALLAAPGDARELAAKLRLLRSEPILRQRLGHAAREEALREHGWKRRVCMILDAVSASQPQGVAHAG